MDQIIGHSTIDASFDATLLFAFAVISLVLAAVGLFGALSYIAAQREQVMPPRAANPVHALPDTCCRSGGVLARQRDAAFGRNFGMHGAGMASPRLDPMTALRMEWQVLNRGSVLNM